MSWKLLRVCICVLSTLRQFRLLEETETFKRETTCEHAVFGVFRLDDGNPGDDVPARRVWI